MRPMAPCGLVLAWSLAVLPFFSVSWEINTSDLEEKDVDEFSSSGFKCPTCFALKERKCETELKWCAADRIKCIEFSGIINTGVSNIPMEMKRCIRADICKEMVTSYMGFPITNQNKNCKAAIGGGARIRPPAPIFFVLFLEKLLH